MFSKTVLFSSLFFIVAVPKLAFAAPPACLLKCVNEQPKVEDFKAICGTNAAEVAQCLRDACNKDVYQAAIDDFKGQCKAAGTTVVIPTATQTTLATKTSTNTATKTASGTSTSHNTSAATTSGASTSEHNAVGKNSANTIVALAAVLVGIIAV